MHYLVFQLSYFYQLSRKSPSAIIILVSSIYYFPLLHLIRSHFSYKQDIFIKSYAIFEIDIGKIANIFQPSPRLYLNLRSMAMSEDFQTISSTHLNAVGAESFLELT
jgi:hypothetical protein